MSARVLPPEVIDVIEGRRRWALVHGDALMLLLLLPDACIHAVITDPPYSSGGAFRGDRMGSTSSKYVTSATQITRPEFSGDNRGWVWRGIVPWDKTEGASVSARARLLELLPPWGARVRAAHVVEVSGLAPAVAWAALGSLCADGTASVNNGWVYRGRFAGETRRRAA